MSKATRNPAMSNTSDMDTLDTREGTPVVEGKVVEMSTWVPVGKEVQEGTCESDTHPGAGTQSVASGSKQGKERVYKPSVVCAAPPPPCSAKRRHAPRTPTACSVVPPPAGSMDRSKPVHPGALSASLERVPPLAVCRPPRTPSEWTRLGCVVAALALARAPQPRLRPRHQASPPGPRRRLSHSVVHPHACLPRRQLWRQQLRS
jgi:hypothetical protein